MTWMCPAYDVTVYEYAGEGVKLPRDKIKQRKKKLYERIAALCEVPEDAVGNIPVFVIRGRHEIEVSGCSGVREYSDSRIVLSVGRESFTVTGDLLVLTDFRDNTLYVQGNIDSAYFGIGEGDSSC